MSACDNAPVCIFQLVIVHIKQQAAVVVKHRGHPYYGYCVIIYERSEIAKVPVSVSAVHKPPGAAALCTGEYLIHD